jgi:hypothetical protein
VDSFTGNLLEPGINRTKTDRTKTDRTKTGGIPSRVHKHARSVLHNLNSVMCGSRPSRGVLEGRLYSHLAFVCCVHVCHQSVMSNPLKTSRTRKKKNRRCSSHSCFSGQQTKSAWCHSSRCQLFLALSPHRWQCTHLKWIGAERRLCDSESSLHWLVPLAGVPLITESCSGASGELPLEQLG